MQAQVQVQVQVVVQVQIQIQVEVQVQIQLQVQEQVQVEVQVQEQVEVQLRHGHSTSRKAGRRGQAPHLQPEVGDSTITCSCSPACWQRPESRAQAHKVSKPLVPQALLTPAPQGLWPNRWHRAPLWDNEQADFPQVHLLPGPSGQSGETGKD